MHQSLMQTVAGLSTRVKALLFAAVLVLSVSGANFATTITSKAHANPADYMTYNWTTVFPDDPNEAGIMKVLACKAYRSDPYFGAVYDVSLWVVNDTNHHRTFAWEQWRADPPNSMHKVRDVGSSSTWAAPGTQMAPEFTVSAWPYTDIVMGRFLDPSMPLRTLSWPADYRMADCY